MSSAGGTTTSVGSAQAGGFVSTGGITSATSFTSSGATLAIGGAPAAGGTQALGGTGAGDATATGGSTQAISDATGGSAQTFGGMRALGGSATAGEAGAVGTPIGGNAQTFGGAQALGGTAAVGGATTTGGSTQSGGADTAGGTNGSNSATGGNTSQTTGCSGQLSQALSPCTGMQIEPVATKGNVLLVLDASGSMNNTATVGAATSKWVSLRSAVASVLSSAPSNLHFGLELFPYDPSGSIFDTVDPAVSCGVGLDSSAIAVNIDPKTNTRASIDEALANYAPAGGTPTAEALGQAYAYFATGAGKDLMGAKWVILVSDGAPNCNLGLACDVAHCTQNMDCKCGNGCGTTLNCCAPSGGKDYGYICLDETETILAVDRLMTVGVRTFVVGLAGTEKFETVFTNLALAGGAPSPETGGYYAVAGSSGTTGIEQALQTIVARAGSSCDIPLTTSPTNLAETNLAIDCSLIPQSSEGGTTTNWSIDITQSPPRLNLGTAACDAGRTSVGSGLQLVTGCPTVSL